MSLEFIWPHAEGLLSLQLSFRPADLFGASGSKPLKPQRSLPGTPVSVTHFPIDLRTSMEEKYKEIAEVRDMTLRRIHFIPTFLFFFATAEKDKCWSLMWLNLDEYQILKSFVWISHLDSPKHVAQPLPVARSCLPVGCRGAASLLWASSRCFLVPHSVSGGSATQQLSGGTSISDVCIHGRVP